MKLALKDLTKDISNIDAADILSCWKWRLGDLKDIITVSCLGDVFLTAQDGAVYWLQTDCGDLTKIANSVDEYQQLLNDENHIDNWFLPVLIESLLSEGKTLQENQVYGYIKLPVIGGTYTVENIEPTDISVHFSFCGQVCQQIENLPDGTSVTIKFDKMNAPHSDSVTAHWPAKNSDN